MVVTVLLYVVRFFCFRLFIHFSHPCFTNTPSRNNKEKALLLCSSLAPLPWAASRRGTLFFVLLNCISWTDNRTTPKLYWHGFVHHGMGAGVASSRTKRSFSHYPFDYLGFPYDFPRLVPSKSAFIRMVCPFISYGIRFNRPVEKPMWRDLPSRDFVEHLSCPSCTS